MNKVVLIGRLTKDPEVRYSQAGEPIAVARYTLAVNRRFKREGEPDADFVGCVVFGKGGEFAEKYFKKGMQIAVCGRIQTRTWDDQQGQKHYVTEVVVEDQEFTESKAAFDQRNQGGFSQPSYPQQGGYQQPSYPQQGGYQQPAPQPQPFNSFNNTPQDDSFLAISDSIDDDDLPF